MVIGFARYSKPSGINLIPSTLFTFQEFEKADPETKEVLLYLIIIDLINSFVRELISLKDCRKAGWVAYFLILTIPLASIFIAVKLSRSVKWLTVIPDSIGALLFFYGDNALYLLEKYKEQDGLLCFLVKRTGAIICLGLALLIFKIPHYLLKFSAGSDKKHSELYRVMDLMLAFVKLDAIFTIIEAIQTGEFRDVSLIFFCLCVLFYWFLSIMYGVYYFKRHCNWRALLLILLLAVIFPMYLLADNHKPLDSLPYCEFSKTRLAFITLIGSVYIPSGIFLVFFDA